MSSGWRTSLVARAVTCRQKGWGFVATFKPQNRLKRLARRTVLARSFWPLSGTLLCFGLSELCSCDRPEWSFGKVPTACMVSNSHSCQHPSEQVEHDLTPDICKVPSRASASGPKYYEAEAKGCWLSQWLRSKRTQKGMCMFVCRQARHDIRRKPRNSLRYQPCLSSAATPLAPLNA